MEQGISPNITEKPPITTVWIDVSVVLVLSKGFIAGIPRTILKIVECWLEKPMRGVAVKFCVFTEEHGVMAVNAEYLREHIRELSQPKERDIEHLKSQSPPRIRTIVKRILKGRPLRFIRDYWVGPPPRSRLWIIPIGLRRFGKFMWFGPSIHSQNLSTPQLEDDSKPLRIEPKPNRFDSVTLGSKEIVISLGGVWITRNLVKTIQAYQERDRFQFISLIYDLIPILYPQYFDDRLVNLYTPPSEWQFRQSNILLAISQHVRNDIIRYTRDHNITTGPVETIILGADSTKIINFNTRLIERPYILTVGSIETRKNHYGMYLAWKKLARRIGVENAPLLVMAGKPAWQGAQILHLIQNDPDSKDIIQVRTSVTDAELDSLYQNCLFTIYPSLNEGWGLPVEESFAYGKLCITTTAASLPEVGGTFADYVEPEDIDSLVNGVIKALDPEYRKQREEHIRQHYTPNTWHACAQQIENIVLRYYRVER